MTNTAKEASPLNAGSWLVKAGEQDRNFQSSLGRMLS